MRLSEFENVKKENIINEKEFEVLGIVASKTDKKICTFIDDEKFIKELNDNVTMVITTKELCNKISNKQRGIYISNNPRIEFFLLHNELCNNTNYIRKKFKTKIGKNCIISENAYIAKENVIIGNNVIIEEFVSIKNDVIIGDNTIIRTGTVIGSSGFEFKKINQTIIPVKHVGGVVIGKNVEIKCNTTIDKAIYPWDNTEIGDYTKIDNLNHIGHACKIGSCVMMPAGSVIGGRTVVKDNAWIGIGSIIRNGITIGENARSNMGAVVTKNVGDNENVTGNFAISHDKFINNIKKWSEGI